MIVLRRTFLFRRAAKVDEDMGAQDPRMSPRHKKTIGFGPASNLYSTASRPSSNQDVDLEEQSCFLASSILPATSSPIMGRRGRIGTPLPNANMVGRSKR